MLLAVLGTCSSEEASGDTGKANAYDEATSGTPAAASKGFHM